MTVRAGLQVQPERVRVSADPTVRNHVCWTNCWCCINIPCVYILMFGFGFNRAIKVLVVVVLGVTFKPLELCSATVAVFGTSQANCLLWCLYWCLKRRTVRPGIQLDCFIFKRKKADFSISFFLFFFFPPRFDVCGEERKSCNRYNQEGNIYSFITGPQAVIKTSHQPAIIFSILITSASSR